MFITHTTMDKLSHNTHVFALKYLQLLLPGGGGGTPYIQMIGMIVVFLGGCNRRFGIF